jgi:hypothetical protein
MHSPFFPLSSEGQLVERQALISQEFHIYDESMLASRFFYLSDKVPVIWNSKAKAVESGEVYIGG